MDMNIDSEAVNKYVDQTALINSQRTALMEQQHCIAVLEEHNAQLRDYAGHTPGCPGVDWARHPERGCSCGWETFDAGQNF